MKPYAPIFSMTPDITAETWLGALAWADGSQMWSGMMPALAPNPIKAASAMSVAEVESAESEPAAGSWNEPV